MVWNEPIKKTLSRPVGWLDTVFCFSLWNSDFSNLIVFNLKRFESLFVAPLLLQNNVFEPCVRKHHDTASQSDTDFVCIFHNDWDYFLDKHMIFLCILNQNLRLYINISSNIHINISKLDVLGKKIPNGSEVVFEIFEMMWARGCLHRFFFAARFPG